MAATHRQRAGSNVTQLIQPANPAVEFAQIECHSEGHQWRPAGKLDPSEAEPGMRPPSWTQLAVGRRSQCVSCGAERVRWYTRSGDVVNRYRYQNGYLHDRSQTDEPAPSRLDWRKRLVVSLFDDLGVPEQAEPQRRSSRGRRRA